MSSPSRARARCTILDEARVRSLQNALRRWREIGVSIEHRDRIRFGSEERRRSHPLGAGHPKWGRVLTLPYFIGSKRGSLGCGKGTGADLGCRNSRVLGQFAPLSRLGSTPGRLTENRRCDRHSSELLFSSTPIFPVDKPRTEDLTLSAPSRPGLFRGHRPSVRRRAIFRTGHHIGRPVKWARDMSLRWQRP